MDKISETDITCTEQDCELTFKTEVQLVRHRRSAHPLEHAHKCQFPGCDDTFEYSWSLRKHQKTKDHFVKVYSCNVHDCDYSATRLGEIFHHQHSVHPELFRFKCELPGCNKSYATKHALSTHRRVDHVRQVAAKADAAEKDTANEEDAQKAHPVPKSLTTEEHRSEYVSSHQKVETEHSKEVIRACQELPAEHEQEISETCQELPNQHDKELAKTHPAHVSPYLQTHTDQRASHIEQEGLTEPQEHLPLNKKSSTNAATTQALDDDSSGSQIDLDCSTQMTQEIKTDTDDRILLRQIDELFETIVTGLEGEQRVKAPDNLLLVPSNTPTRTECNREPGDAVKSLISLLSAKESTETAFDIIYGQIIRPRLVRARDPVATLDYLHNRLIRPFAAELQWRVPTEPVLKQSPNQRSLGDEVAALTPIERKKESVFVSHQPQQPSHSPTTAPSTETPLVRTSAVQDEQEIPRKPTQKTKPHEYQITSPAQTPDNASRISVLTRESFESASKTSKTLTGILSDGAQKAFRKFRAFVDRKASRIKDSRDPDASRSNKKGPVSNERAYSSKGKFAGASVSSTKK